MKTRESLFAFLQEFTMANSLNRAAGCVLWKFFFIVWMDGIINVAYEMTVIIDSFADVIVTSCLLHFSNVSK